MKNYMLSLLLGASIVSTSPAFSMTPTEQEDLPTALAVKKKGMGELHRITDDVFRSVVCLLNLNGMGELTCTSTYMCSLIERDLYWFPIAKRMDIPALHFPDLAQKERVRLHLLNLVPPTCFSDPTQRYGVNINQLKYLCQNPCLDDPSRYTFTLGNNKFAMKVCEAENNKLEDLNPGAIVTFKYFDPSFMGQGASPSFRTNVVFCNACVDLIDFSSGSEITCEHDSSNYKKTVFEIFKLEE